MDMPRALTDHYFVFIFALFTRYTDWYVFSDKSTDETKFVSLIRMNHILRQHLLVYGPLAFFPVFFVQNLIYFNRSRSAFAALTCDKELHGVSVRSDAHWYIYAVADSPCSSSFENYVLCVSFAFVFMPWIVWHLRKWRSWCHSVISGSSVWINLAS